MGNHSEQFCIEMVNGLRLRSIRGKPKATQMQKSSLRNRYLNPKRAKIVIIESASIPNRIPTSMVPLNRSQDYGQDSGLNVTGSSEEFDRNDDNGQLIQQESSSSYSGGYQKESFLDKNSDTEMAPGSPVLNEIIIKQEIFNQNVATEETSTCYYGGDGESLFESETDPLESDDGLKLFESKTGVAGDFPRFQVQFSESDSYRNFLIVKGQQNKPCYTCAICGAVYKQLTRIKKHCLLHESEEHNGGKPYKCEFCGKAFSYKAHLKVHKRGHTGEKPYKCRFCDGIFGRSFDLRLHERKHTGEKPYHCNFCDKTFRLGSVLKEHERIHTGEKPYKCDHCHKTFGQRSHAKSHQRMHKETLPMQIQVVVDNTVLKM